ncbi:MAG: hypothetical protein H8E55_09405 [Pelagibacterales bacterium]|nr:hypothetical protein [Pelagibacterales bacterium]
MNVECDSCGKLDFCKYMDNYISGQTEILCIECIHNMTKEEKEEYEDNNT